MNRGRLEVLEAPFSIVRSEGSSTSISESSDKAVAADDAVLVHVADKGATVSTAAVVAGSIEKHESRRISPYKVKREHARGNTDERIGRGSLIDLDLAIDEGNGIGADLCYCGRNAIEDKGVVEQPIIRNVGIARCGRRITAVYGAE